jgi:hypothetical protein
MCWLLWCECVEEDGGWWWGKLLGNSRSAVVVVVVGQRARHFLGWANLFLRIEVRYPIIQ